MNSFIFSLSLFLSPFYIPFSLLVQEHLIVSLFPTYVIILYSISLPQPLCIKSSLLSFLFYNVFLLHFLLSLYPSFLLVLASARLLYSESIADSRQLVFLAAVRQRHTHRVNEDKVSGLKKEKNAWLHCHPEANEGTLTVGVIEGRHEDDEILAAFQQRPYTANAGWVE